MSPLGYESPHRDQMVHGHSNDARFEPQEWFERHLEDRGGEVTELICFEPLNWKDRQAWSLFNLEMLTLKS